MVLSGSPSVKPALQHCTVRCVDDGRFGPGVKTCWYDEKPMCSRGQNVCENTSSRECLPTVVSLGQFDPAHDGVTDTFTPATTPSAPPPPPQETPSYVTSGYRLMGF